MTEKRFPATSPSPEAGVFETMRVSAGAVVELRRHLKRLAASVEALYGTTLPPSLEADIGRAVAGHDSARLRVDVRPAADRIEVGLDVGPIPARNELELVPFRVGRALGEHKLADREALIRAEEALAPALPLLVDSDGLVLEASRANVFAVLAGRLITPPLDGRILPGVARACTIESARALGIPVDETPLPLTRLLDADELFVTASLRGVEPVRRCGTWAREPAEITRALAAHVEARWR